MVPEPAKVIRLEPEVQRHVRARLARLPKEVSTLQTQAKLRLLQRVRKFFNSADDALFAHADQAGDNLTQNAYFDAMRQLRTQSKAVERRFLEAIDEAFAQLVEADGRDTFSLDGQLSADALSLVQNDDLQQMVILESTVSRAERDFADVLHPFVRSLDACVPVAVNSANNPVGPHVICAAALAQFKRLEMDKRATQLLFRQFDEVVVSALPSILVHIGPLLPEVTVAPKTELRERSVSPAERHARLLNWLSEAQRAAAESSTSPSAPLGTLLGQTPFDLNLVECETVRMVELLFRYILQDPALAEAAKAQLSRLEIPFLKVALHNENFFTDRDHPARRLLNTMASAALGVQSEQQDNAVLEQIGQAVDQVLRQYQDDEAVLMSVLAGFEQFVEQDRHRSALAERRTVGAEDGKAKIAALRTKASAAVEDVLKAQPVPGCVERLLGDLWANVVFTAGLRSEPGSEPWMQQLEIARQLVSSVQPLQNPAQRHALIQQLPVLLKSLREGLDLISHNPFDVEKLFSELEEVHLALIRGADLVVSAPEPEALVVNDVARAAAPVPDEVYMQMVANFAQGAWFDLAGTGGEMLRCRLAAFIKPTGKYIFVNRSGGKVAEHSQAELAQALKSGQLKPLDDSMLFDRALESIVTGMRKNKVAMPLDLPKDS